MIYGKRSDVLNHRSPHRAAWLAVLLLAPTFVAGKCGSDPLSLGSSDAGAAGSIGKAGSSADDAGTCAKAECGPQLGIANFECPDGSLAGPTGRCLMHSNGSCGWEVRVCPVGGGGGSGTGAGGLDGTGNAAGIANEGGSANAGSTDPCAGMTLPDCTQCSDGAALSANCGKPCALEGDSCSNEIGDGRACQNGTWLCQVHPPLGTGCNRVCRAPSGGTSEGSAGSGEMTGGSGGITEPECTSLLALVQSTLAAAQSCNTASKKPELECAGTLEGVCCPVLVEDASATNSARNQAYLDALHAYRAQCQHECPRIACFDPVPGTCNAATGSTIGTCSGGKGF